MGSCEKHDCVGVAPLFSSLPSRVAKLAKEVTENIPLCEGLLKGFEGLENNVDEERKKNLEDMDKYFTECHENLEKKRKAAVESLNEMYDEFQRTVVQRKKALATLHTKCDDFIGRVCAEGALPQNEIDLYALFHTLTSLNSVMKVVAKTEAPDESSKICTLGLNQTLTAEAFHPVTVKAMFRWASGTRQVYNINLDRLRESRSAQSLIPTVEASSHDGSAFYDPGRNIIVAVSGNGNNCRDVCVTTVTDGTHGTTIRRADIIPFGSHGQYPIFDGVRYAYFCQSEDDDNNRFGRLDLDNWTFEDLPSIPGSFKEFCSGCCALGKIYAITDEDRMLEFDPATRAWNATPLHIRNECRLLADPLNSGVFYALESNGGGFFEIDGATFAKTLISSPEDELDLNQNGEALIVALPDMSRVLFTCLSGTWWCYLFERNEWIQLEHWDDAENGSAHLVIVPFGPSALYHQDETDHWLSVNLA